LRADWGCDSASISSSATCSIAAKPPEFLPG
jgi:hypothetical protein